MAAGSTQPTVTREFKITPTMAHDWALCGGFFAARHQGGGGRGESYRCKLGTAVHELVAAYDRIAGSGRQDLDDIIMRHWRPGRFGVADDQRARAEARVLLAAYAAIRGTEQVELLAGECYWQTGRRVVSPGQYIRLSGRIDRVARRADGVLEVLDFKTTETLPTHDELRCDPATTIYHLLAEERHGMERIAVAQRSLSTRARVEVELTADDIAAGKVQIRAMTRQMAAGTYARTPGPACGYCPCRDDCPAVQVADNDPELPF